MKKEQKVREEKLKIQPTEAFVFKCEAELVSETIGQSDNPKQEQSQFEQMLKMTNQNIDSDKGEKFDSSKCPKKVEFIFNVTVHDK